MGLVGALAQVDDRVRGLRAGDDDYLTKPYSFAELMARIEALHLMHHAGQVVTRTMLLEAVWDITSSPKPTSSTYT